MIATDHRDTMQWRTAPRQHHVQCACGTTFHGTTYYFALRAQQQHRQEEARATQQ